MDTTCHLSLVLWLWARGTFCVDSEGKIQDYSVPFHLFFSCLQLFRPCSDSCLGGVSKKHDSDGLTTEKHRRLCFAWLVTVFRTFLSATMCPTSTMYFTSKCDDSLTLVHTLFNGVGFSSVYQQTKANKENNLSRWHWEFEKEKTYLRQKSTGPN